VVITLTLRSVPVSKSSFHIITTERLALRHFNDEDADFLVELLNSESWLKYIGDRKVADANDAKNYLQRSAYKAIASHGYAMMRVSLAANDQPIGMCGLFKRDELDLPDLGFALMPQHEGKGYAFEASKAVLDHAHEHMNMKEVYAITNNFNDRSIALLSKLGFKHTEQRYNKEFQEFLEIYKLDKLR
jgi:[ribosomal protein S5]-alanine N-acetyltransferase